MSTRLTFSAWLLAFLACLPDPLQATGNIEAPPDTSFLPPDFCPLTTDNNFPEDSPHPVVVSVCQIDLSEWQGNDTRLNCDPISEKQLRQFRNQQGQVALMFAGFGAIRLASGTKSLPSLIHATITAAAGTHYYLTENATLSQQLAAPPSYEDNWQNFFPLVLYAYGSYEIIEAYKTDRKQFVLHGFLVATICSAAHYTGKLVLLYPGLLMEVSQIFYNAGLLYNHVTKSDAEHPPTLFSAPFFIIFIGIRWFGFTYEALMLLWDTIQDGGTQFMKAPGMYITIGGGALLIQGMNFYSGHKMIKIIRNKWLKPAQL